MRNDVLEKSFAFAVRVIKLRKYLLYEAPIKEYELSKQIVRSGTSVGANIEEAQGAQSTSDFLSKIQIAYKEARETRYWIRLLQATNYISAEQAESIFADIDEICKILSKIIMSTKDKLSTTN